MRRFQRLIHTFTLQLATVGLLSAAANAQLFNVDFGDPLVGTTLDCAPTYAAAGSAGVWNSIIPHAGVPVGLVDKSGAATSVTLTASPGLFGCWNFPNPAYLGEDANLMQDFTYGGPGGTAEWIELSGLNNETYIVYTYAQSPDLKLAVTAVDCTESTDGIQNVGGAPWPGSHQQFVSYARHTAIVTNGTLHIDVVSVNGSWPALNGFQLEPGSLGSSYCTATVNSTGSASLISASGSGSISVASNDLVFSAGPGPASEPGIFYYGPDQIQVPFGNGNRCVGGGPGTIVRVFPFAFADASGFMSASLDNTNPAHAQVVPGATLNFQAWFRDPLGGGAGFNLSDGLSVTFVP